MGIGKPRKVASDPARMIDIAWSPDSHSLCRVGGDGRMCLLDVSSGEERVSALRKHGFPAGSPVAAFPLLGVVRRRRVGR